MAVAIPGETLERHLLSQRFRPLAHVAWARQANTTVLLDTERGIYYTLNEVASRSWELLAAGEPLIEILRCLADEFEAANEALHTDTVELVEQLLDLGLIERASP